MSGRSQQILSRFPAHLEAARQGKKIGVAVEALALDLDVISARMAAVRRSHRLADADELTDLLRIADLHDLTPGELELAFMRFARGRALAVALAATSEASKRDDAAAALTELWSIEAPHPRLLLFAPGGGTPDLDAAKTRLVAAAGEALRYDTLCDAMRSRIGVTCRIHARGNGTVRALLEGAANALDLDIGSIVHSADRYWHAAAVTDRLALMHPVVGADGAETAMQLAPASELIGIEENPLYRAQSDSTARRHAECFALTRRGFDRALLQVRITGLPGHRTLGPCFVNRDEGIGVGFTGLVAPGKTLFFNEDGRTMLEGADVTSFAYAWKGACFAGDDLDPKLDFSFDGDGRDPKRPAATFVTMICPAALDRETLDPGAGESLTMPGIAVGVTRFAFFVQESAFNSLEGPAEAAVVRRVTPRTRAATLDDSVFAPVRDAAGAVVGALPAASGEVQLSWLEHRAYAVRLLIPPRFRAFEDKPDAPEVLRRVGIAIDRFRPVGVEVGVEFIDDRWVLGVGTLTSGVDDDLIEQLRSATALWQAPLEPAPA